MEPRSDTFYNQVEAGWDVHGSDGEKIGKIEEVGRDYLLVVKGLIFTTDLYVPLNAIRDVDPAEGRVYLNVAKAEVEQRGWTEPPPTVGETGYTSVVRGDRDDDGEVGGEAIGGGAGALSGAVIGGAVAGPPGAVIGGVAGAAGGAIAGERAEGGDDESGSGVGGGAGALGGAVLGGAVAGPPGAVVGGAVGAGAGGAMGDKAQEESDEESADFPRR